MKAERAGAFGRGSVFAGAAQEEKGDINHTSQRELLDVARRLRQIGNMVQDGKGDGFDSSRWGVFLLPLFNLGRDAFVDVSEGV